MSELPGNVELRATLDREHDGYSIADTEMMRALSRAEDRHFWHDARNHFIALQLARLGCEPPARVLELGCGGGCVSAALARAGYAVTGVDGHLPRVLEAAARAPQAHFIVEDLSQANALPETVDFDAVGLFDVLEHLDDPRAALVQALQRVRPGGLVVGTVPALMSLWSDADERAHHRLRYDRRSLDALLASLDDVTEREALPFNRLLVPPIFVQRRLLGGDADAETGAGYLRVPPAPINALLGALLRAEYRLAGQGAWARRLPGASLWFACRRPASR